MDETFPVNLLRNVQPTDRKLSVSKEHVGPKKQDEKNQKRPDHDRAGDRPQERPQRLYGREIPAAEDTDEEGSTINITV